MLVLIGIAFAAGFITAISPCVLPVLPIMFAGGATGSRRQPFAIIAGLIVSFTAFTLFGVVAAEEARAARGLPAEPRDRAALPRRGHAPLPAGRASSSSGRSCGSRAARAGDLGGGFLLGASLGLVFVPCAGPVLGCDHGRRGDAGRRLPRAIVLTLAYATGAAIPMLIVAFGGRRRDDRAPPARAPDPARPRRRRRAHRARDRAQRRPPLPDRAPGLHGVAAEEGRAERRARNASSQKAPAARTRAPADTTLRDLGAGARVRRPLALDQQQAADAPRAARQGRPRRLLDVLVHQLPADAPAREGLVPDVSRRTGSSSSACTRPSSRSSTCRRTSAGPCSRLGSRYPVALDNDYRTWNAFRNQYWPAKYLIDRRGHLRYVPLRRGRVRHDRGADPHAARRERGDAPGRRRALATRPRTARTTPESYLGYDAPRRGSSGTPDHAGPPRDVPLPGRELPAERARLRGPVARRTASASSPAPERGCGSVPRAQRASRARRPAARSRPASTASPCGPCRVNGSRLYTLLDMRRQRKGLLELRFTPGVRGYAFTFG